MFPYKTISYNIFPTIRFPKKCFPKKCFANKRFPKKNFPIQYFSPQTFFYKMFLFPMFPIQFPDTMELSLFAANYWVENQFFSSQNVSVRKLFPSPTMFLPQNVSYQERNNIQSPSPLPIT